jgi:ArsR family transcriptional regulator
MEKQAILKVLADDTRLKIVELLLRHNYCVRALARKICVSEAAVSQHLKILREANLLVGEKKGYYMHYDVDRKILHELAQEIDSFVAIEREVCTQNDGKCTTEEKGKCHAHEDHERKTEPCDKTTIEFCHGTSEEHSAPATTIKKMNSALEI